MRGITPNRRNGEDLQLQSRYSDNQNLMQSQIQTQQGYTEFFSWGNDEDGQLGHGQENADRKKIFNLPKSLSFEVLITQVSQQGYVFSFGCNSDGQLGVNDQGIKFSTAPLLVSDLISLQATPTQISCGGFHTAVVTTFGEVYMWGRNLQGQCGRAISYNQFLFTPHKLHLDQSSKQLRFVDCGDQHTAVVTKNGELYTFGDNSEGQLGIGIEFKNNIDRPTLVTGISEETIQVSCGFRHTLALTDHGTVFCMGSNKRFELGASSSLQKSSQPIRIQTLDMYKVRKVVAGSFSAALTTTSELLIWGSGDFGVFQNPQKIYMDDIKFLDISLSKSMDTFGAAVDDQGLVYTWGQNSYGQLGQGDFRFRKLPTKISQLRKKKVRLIACGGGFVAALGKDVLDGQAKKREKKTQKEEVASNRSKSQVTFGTNSVGPSSSLRRKRGERGRNDLDQTHLSTLNDQPSQQRSNIKERQTHHSHEGGRGAYDKSTYQHYQTPLQDHNITATEFSIERQKRTQLERDIKDKEYELQTIKQQSQIVQDVQQQLAMYKRDNEVLRNALEKEQENSYKLLSDIHSSLNDNKHLKEQLEDKNRDIRNLQLEGKRQLEKTREMEYENDKLKQDSLFLAQRSEEELLKLKSYIAECENTIKNQRDQQRDLASKLEQHKYVDQAAEKLKQENAELKRQLYQLQDKMKQMEFQIDNQQKENDDLKYDNTLLYDKNVQKDDKLAKISEELDRYRGLIEQERGKNQIMDKDQRYLQKRIQELEDQLQMELQKSNLKEKTVDELVREAERLRKNLENEIAKKNIDYDNLKRGFDEQAYENENLRHSLNAKQDEIASLNKIIAQSSQNNNELVNTIRELENTIRDVEEKNKRLVDLLNANMYNRAERYKEQVINKLQERTPNSMITPNKSTNGYSNLQINSEVSEFKQGQQPSPIRLQKILSDEKEQVNKERERLLKLADGLTKGHDLSKSVGAGNNPNSQADYRQSMPQFISPFQQNNEVSPNRSYTNSMYRRQPYQELQPQVEGGYQNFNAGKLRVSDLSGGLVNLATPHQYNNNLGQRSQQQNDPSPERIADILKQNSPLRKMIAKESLTNINRADDSTPNKSVHFQDDSSRIDEDNQGNMTASKITHKLISSELGELKNRLQYMQREKQDLDARLHQYESNSKQL